MGQSEYWRRIQGVRPYHPRGGAKRAIEARLAPRIKEPNRVHTGSRKTSPGKSTTSRHRTHRPATITPILIIGRPMLISSCSQAARIREIWQSLQTKPIFQVARKSQTAETKEETSRSDQFLADFSQKQKNEATGPSSLPITNEATFQVPARTSTQKKLNQLVNFESSFSPDFLQILRTKPLQPQSTSQSTICNCPCRSICSATTCPCPRNATFCRSSATFPTASPFTS